MKRYQMASTIRNMSKPLPPSRTAPQFVVRFPDEEMRDRIKQAAEANNRSMNAEIIARLQQSFVAETESGKARPNSAVLAAQLGITGRRSLGAIDAEEAAEHVADKVVSKLIGADEFIAKLQRILLDQDKDGNPTQHNKPRTPTIPGVNAPKGGSKAPKK